jgi:hypothetical protein
MNYFVKMSSSCNDDNDISEERKILPLGLNSEERPSKLYTSNFYYEIMNKDKICNDWPTCPTARYSARWLVTTPNLHYNTSPNNLKYSDFASNMRLNIVGCPKFVPVSKSQHPCCLCRVFQNNSIWKTLMLKCLHKCYFIKKTFGYFKTPK